jgi:hypothetical protein
LALAALLAFAAGADAQTRKSHVRVVLDVSGSMETNDPDRLAVLATLLLRDLVNPNTTLGDSFEVIPFDPAWTGSGDVPTSNGPAVAADYRNPADFNARLNALAYDIDYTFFSPGLRAAMEDLEKTPGGDYDTRVAVLVTDGLPIPSRRERDAEIIKSELVPRLEAAHVRLYVLAFGSEASANRGYFEDLVPSSLGQVFVDADGSDLLRTMIRIFERSFGYTAGRAQTLPGVAEIDLDGGTTPQRVAVVVTSERPTPVPEVELKPPPAGSLNVPEPPRSASERGASYTLTWVLSPHRGDYGFAANNVLAGSVAVLRPTRLDLGVHAAPPQNHQVERTMAQTPFHLRIRVSSPGGGDPGPVELSFRLLGERRSDASTGAPSHAWVMDYEGPAARDAAGDPQPDGRYFPIVATFPENESAPGELYVGYLEARAKRGEAVVGELVEPFAHRIEVYPRIAVDPVPATRNLSDTALQRREKACAVFKLELVAGALPHPERDEYGIRALLEPPDPKVLGAELRQARFTLDGQPLDVAGQTVQEPSPWSAGRLLSQAAFLGEHEICVQLGRPTAGNPALDLPVVFTLQETPYDDFRVISPFVARVLVAQPSWVEKWQTLWLVLLALLALLAALWYGRDRLAFPPDLGYAIGPDTGDPPMTGRSLPEGGFLARLLGLRDGRPVLIPGQDRALAEVRPLRDELYQLRLARGVEVESVDPHAPLERSGRRATIAVHRLYRLTRGRESYHFRMEYR